MVRREGNRADRQDATMKETLKRLSQRYAAALGVHLNRGVGTGLAKALKLGRTAASMGLETLGLARVHQQALEVLKLSSGDRAARRAKLFFSEAVAPIIETHQAARQAKTELVRLNAMLNRRTVELAATNRQIQCGVLRRKNVEAALKTSDRRHAKLLKESLLLQQGLRRLAHQALAAQEVEREQLSHELQDEIAQTLLGINVRLISLTREAQIHAKGFKGEIASTRRLVARSARSVRQVARRVTDS